MNAVVCIHVDDNQMLGLVCGSEVAYFGRPKDKSLGCTPRLLRRTTKKWPAANEKQARWASLLMSSTDPFDDGLFDDDDSDVETSLPPTPSKPPAGGVAFDDVEKLMEMGLGCMAVAQSKGPLDKGWGQGGDLPVHDVEFMRDRWKKYESPNVGLVLGKTCGEGGTVVVEADNEAGEKWIQENLPATPPGEPAGDACPRPRVASSAPSLRPHRRRWRPCRELQRRPGLRGALARRPHGPRLRRARLGGDGRGRRRREEGQGQG
jgi:hypothetical protein